MTDDKPPEEYISDVPDDVAEAVNNDAHRLTTAIAAAVAVNKPNYVMSVLLASLGFVVTCAKDNMPGDIGKETLIEMLERMWDHISGDRKGWPFDQAIESGFKQASVVFEGMANLATAMAQKEKADLPPDKIN